MKPEMIFEFRKWNSEAISDRLIHMLPRVRKFYENRKFTGYRKWGQGSLIWPKMKSAPKTMSKWSSYWLSGASSYSLEKSYLRWWRHVIVTWSFKTGNYPSPSEVQFEDHNVQSVYEYLVPELRNLFLLCFRHQFNFPRKFSLKIII